MSKINNPKLIIGIPCHNEERSIGKVVTDFHLTFPEAEIWVVDNNCTDGTATVAKQSGTKVFFERRKGKGYAVRKIFNEFEGDFLILIDGDGTYLASDAKFLFDQAVKEQADLAVGNRMMRRNRKEFSFSHWWGNKFVTAVLNALFGTGFQDVESGLRVLSGDFVRSSAMLSSGFGVEPEITVLAIEKEAVVREYPISVLPRMKGSYSKLRTFQDGAVVLYTMISLFRDYRPLKFFSYLALGGFLTASFLGWYSVRDYLTTGIVKHIPALIVGGLFAVCGFISFISGLILSGIKRRYEELVELLSRKKH